MCNFVLFLLLTFTLGLPIPTLLFLLPIHFPSPFFLASLYLSHFHLTHNKFKVGPTVQMFKKKHPILKSTQCCAGITELLEINKLNLLVNDFVEYILFFLQMTLSPLTNHVVYQLFVSTYDYVDTVNCRL